LIDWFIDWLIDRYMDRMIKLFDYFDGFLIVFATS
jgi:hypothetical protein